MPMDKSFKYNSKQPLVHRECLQLPKPHMGAPHVLSHVKARLIRVVANVKFSNLYCLVENMITKTSFHYVVHIALNKGKIPYEKKDFI